MGQTTPEVKGRSEGAKEQNNEKQYCRRNKYFGTVLRHERCGIVLFGGSILEGGDLLAQAIKDRIAKVYVIVGGAGHTTEALRQRVHNEYPAIETAGLQEAEVFQRYLKESILVRRITSSQNLPTAATTSPTCWTC